MKGAERIRNGTIVVLVAGLAREGFAQPGLIIAGVSEESIDNRDGADGAESVRVRHGAFPCDNSTSTDELTVADIGKDCYLVDNNTVARTSGNGTRTRAGRLLRFEKGRPIVHLATPVAEAGPRMQAGTLTLAAGVRTVNTGIVITPGSKVFITPNTPAGGTQGVKYKVPDAALVVGDAGTGAFTVTAIDATGATVAGDTSTLNYLIVG